VLGAICLMNARLSITLHSIRNYILGQPPWLALTPAWTLSRHGNTAGSRFFAARSTRRLCSPRNMERQV